MSEPLRVLLTARRKRKPVPEASTRHLDCPSGYVGDGEDQVRTVTWDVPSQTWVYGPWVRVAFNCILQPAYMTAFIPGDGAKYGTFSGSLAGVPMVAGVVSPSYVANRGGYTANYDIGIRGKNVTDAQCRALGLNPERIVYVNNGDFIHYQIAAYVNHNYGGGFVTFDVRNPGSQAATPFSGKAESVGGWATATKSYTKGYDLINNGNTVVRGNIIGDYQISLAGFSGSGVCSGTYFYFQIMRGAIPASAGSWNVQRIDVLTPLQASGGATRWFTGAAGVQFRPEGRETSDEYGGRTYSGQSLQISIPSPGILVLYDTHQHTRFEPTITGSLAVSPMHTFKRGMGELGSDTEAYKLPGALALPVNAGTITIGPNWNTRDSRTNGYMAYDQYFGFAPF